MMEPISGILDEHFFLVASDDCLSAMAKLVDDMFAMHLQRYLADASANPAVVERINTFLGYAIMRSTFHITLKDRGSCDVVRKIQLSALPTMQGDATSIIEELEYLQKNYQFISAYVEPRNKVDFEQFMRLIPIEYEHVIEVNKSFFYQAAASRRSTGMKLIIDKHDDWLIALKGLKTIRYFQQQGFGSDNFIIARF